MDMTSGTRGISPSTLHGDGQGKGDDDDGDRWGLEGLFELDNTDDDGGLVDGAVDQVQNATTLSETPPLDSRYTPVASSTLEIDTDESGTAHRATSQETRHQGQLAQVPADDPQRPEQKHFELPPEMWFRIFKEVEDIEGRKRLAHIRCVSKPFYHIVSDHLYKVVRDPQTVERVVGNLIASLPSEVASRFFDIGYDTPLRTVVRAIIHENISLVHSSEADLKSLVEAVMKANAARNMLSHVESILIDYTSLESLITRVGPTLDRSQSPLPDHWDWEESCSSVCETGRVAHEYLLLFPYLLRMVFHYDESDEKRLWKPKRERGGPACRASKFNPSTGKFDWRPSNHNLPHWAHPPLQTETETSPENIWKRFSARIAPFALCIVAHPDVYLVPPAKTLSSLTGQVQNLEFYRANTTRCTMYSNLVATIHNIHRLPCTLPYAAIVQITFLRHQPAESEERRPPPVLYVERLAVIRLMLETLKPDTKVLVLVGPQRGIDHENPVPGDISRTQFYAGIRAAAQIPVAGEGTNGPGVSHREPLELQIFDDRHLDCDCESTCTWPAKTELGNLTVTDVAAGRV